ncbi:HPP family protein [Paenibacillus sp. 1_12]|uniref:HPP family protein n=1 Tax=Paenibacillus sp. 1_12 TaxID=1566278 RepID=UPI0008DF3C11|nr:HPP family protein [Paenibacillus sp. 1_12]SFL15600.1 HPP family protein [Paenibacillus sp. 1_12]
MGIKYYLRKMKGEGRSPLVIHIRNVIIGFVGGTVTIAVLAWLTDMNAGLWIMAPFGASCVLAFGLWDSPLSQPRNIIGGHLVSTVTGLTVHHFLGGGVAAMALGVGLAISLMMLTRTTHPPAGADPLVVMMSGSHWSFIWTPVLAGSIVIVIIALIVNNLSRQRAYPKFWW